MKTIGIIGGVGPFAGLDLMEKLLTQTRARCDQEHLPVILHSFPDQIPDRSAFLLGQSAISPVEPLLRILKSVVQAGATVVGIPCNTAHVPRIFAPLQACAASLQITLLNMVDEAVNFVQAEYPDMRRLGLLATIGTYQAGVYTAAFAQAGLEIVLPDEPIQTAVIHQAIYHPLWGIKTSGRPVTPQAKRLLNDALLHFTEKEVDGILLACTELPLAFADEPAYGLKTIDVTLVLARALIREMDQTKLIPSSC